MKRLVYNKPNVSNHFMSELYQNNSNLFDNIIPKNKFIVLYYGDIESGLKEMILDVLQEIIHINLLVDLNKFNLIFFEDDVELKLEHIINSINDDFSARAKLFTGGKISLKSFDYKSTYIASILSFIMNKPNYYFDNSDLIKHLSLTNLGLVKLIKDDVLYYTSEDDSLMMVIKSMFNNDLNVSKTSKDIFMHRNTVINKLEIIKNNTGLNIQKFNHAVAMNILLNC